MGHLGQGDRRSPAGGLDLIPAGSGMSAKGVPAVGNMGMMLWMSAPKAATVAATWPMWWSFLPGTRMVLILTVMPAP
jgi:hypothetical protein